jgi:hypothetical protein
MRWIWYGVSQRKKYCSSVTLLTAVTMINVCNAVLLFYNRTLDPSHPKRECDPVPLLLLLA